MSDMPPSEEHADNNPATVSRNARYGLILFAVYVVFYLGFMLLSAMSPASMAQPVLGGVNLAIVYGFGLIVLALLLALVYAFLCRPVSRD